MSLFSWSPINHISREIRYLRPFAKQHRTHTDTVYGNRVNASGKKLVLKMISCGSQRGDSFRFIQKIEQFVFFSVTSHRIGNGLEDERSDWMQSLKSAPNQISFCWRKSLIPKISTGFRVPSQMKVYAIPTHHLRQSPQSRRWNVFIHRCRFMNEPMQNQVISNELHSTGPETLCHCCCCFIRFCCSAHAFQDRHLFAFAIFALFFCQRPPPPPPSAFYSRTCVAVARRAKEEKCMHFMRSLTFDRIVFVFGFRFVFNERRVLVSM